MTLFAIQDIEPNPFRHMDRYPVRRDKIEALKESIATTSFWDNIVAREVGGKAQIAYGHHRLVALRESFGPEHKVKLIVRDLDETAMLQIMARENLEEWGTSAEVEHETVRAVVEAYAAGRVELAKPAGTAKHTRYAHLRAGAKMEDKPYTADSIAEFLAWSVHKIQPILQALDLIDEGTLHEDDFKGLGGQQAVAVTREASTAKRRIQAQAPKTEPAEVKATAGKVARAARDAMVDGGLGYKQARQVTDKIVPPKPSGPPPNFTDYVFATASKVNHLLRDDQTGERMEAIMPYADEIGSLARRELINCLSSLGERVEAYMKQLVIPVSAEDFIDGDFVDTDDSFVLTGEAYDA